MIKGVFQRLREPRQVIGKFRRAGALSVDLAQSLNDLKLDETPALRKMIRQGILIHAGSKTYFLDERQLMQYRLGRVKWGMVILFLVLLIVLWWVPRFK